MRKTEKYEKPALLFTHLDMDCGFMSVSMVDLSTDSGEHKSATQQFNDGQYQEIY